VVVDDVVAQFLREVADLAHFKAPSARVMTAQKDPAAVREGCRASPEERVMKKS